MYLSKIVVKGFRAAAAAELTCEVPGRFSVLAGANSGGKSTIADAITLSHADVFPWPARPSTAALSKLTSDRYIKVAYSWEDPETLPIWLNHRKLGNQPPEWSKKLKPSMGRVDREGSIPDGYPIQVLHMAPTRNPVNDLAGRDARLLVEMLRSESRRTGGRGLHGLKAHLERLLSAVVKNSLLASVEARVADPLAAVTAGVSLRVPYLATTHPIDDAFLARVFEFFVGALPDLRNAAHRLEVEGLGYANLLHLAVVLAAVPDLTAPPMPNVDADDGSSAVLPVDGDSAAEFLDPHEEARSVEAMHASMSDADDESNRVDDEMFPDQFHAVIVLEEPEAHLHPQLQHGLVRYLRRVVDQRPELQVILTTHSSEIISACDPEELVIMRRDANGHPVARSIRAMKLPDAVVQQTRRHLDVSRTAGLFADRLVIVEGLTDAMLLRTFGRIWAEGDASREALLDALTITLAGSRVGPWLPSLLVSPGIELVGRLAVLMDSDGKATPAWATAFAKKSGDFAVFVSSPTLEPSIVSGNEMLITEVLAQMGVPALWDEPEQATSDLLHEWIKGKGRSGKANFAETACELLESGKYEVAVPSHFEELLTFVLGPKGVAFAEPAVE